MARQMVVVAAEGRKIRATSYPLEGEEWIFLEKVMRGWYTLRQLYTKMRNKNWLVIDQRFSIPLSPYMEDRYTPDEVKKRTDRDIRLDKAKLLNQGKATKDNIRNMTGYTVLVIVAVVFLAFLIIAILLASKTCSIPGVGG